MDKFENFWSLYPRKVSKKQTQKIWKKLKLTDELYEKILKALQDYKQTESWLKRNGQFIPYPSTWLNQERWDDEIIKAEVNINKKPYYNNCPMIKKYGKWYVIEKGGEMLFTGKEKDIKWKE